MIPVTVQAGIFSGDNPSHYNASNPIRLWVIQLSMSHSHRVRCDSHIVCSHHHRNVPGTLVGVFQDPPGKFAFLRCLSSGF